jgi:hypothetical protein
MNASPVTAPAFLWLQALWSSQAPALPAPWAMQLSMALGWALLLAWLGAGLASGMSMRARRVLAAGLAIWTLLPGSWSPDFWLGLAFQAPSLSAMLLCLVGLQRSLGQAEVVERAAALRLAPLSAPAWAVLGVSVVLGYGLLLDTFAVLPMQVYAWGFSPALLLVLLVLALLPWVVFRAQRPGHGAAWLAPAVLLLFAATRLPTGNLWDAVLDPWLWLALQGVLVRRLLRR